MKLLLLGANGRAGREILSQGLAAGNSITALVRTKNRLSDVSHPRLQVCAGDVCDSRFLEPIIAGHDAVISVLGPRLPTKLACEIYSKSARSIVAAMLKTDVSRLLVTSTALLFPSSKLSDQFLRWVAKQNIVHAGLMEKHIISSSLEWTIVRCGFLTNSNDMNLRSANNLFPEGGGSISRAALAKFFINEASDPNCLGQVVGLSN